MGTTTSESRGATEKVGSREWVEEYGLSPMSSHRLGQLEAARRDPRVWSLESDLGDLYGTAFRDEFPDRWVSVGIAESSLIGMAAGLALRGKVPFVNTFASIALMRACEQVRLDVCYHNANVKIVGTFAATHSSFKDIAIARSLPNMTVVAPADAVAMYYATLAAAAWEGPLFLRLGMDATPQVYESCPFEIGKGNVLRDGGDLTLVAAGTQVVHEALEAARALAGEGTHARVIDLHTIKPIDRDLLIQAARETGRVVTVEDHSIYGGLGGAVAEVLAETHPVPMKILGTPDRYCEELGIYEDHLRRYGLDGPGIVASVREWLGKEGGA